MNKFKSTHNIIQDNTISKTLGAERHCPQNQNIEIIQLLFNTGQQTKGRINLHSYHTNMKKLINILITSQMRSYEI